MPVETAADLVAAVERLYRAIQALPFADQPSDWSKVRCRAGSLAYRTLERQIWTLSGRHWRLTSGITITTRPSPKTRKG
jgi:hypothetical protein